MTVMSATASAQAIAAASVRRRPGSAANSRASAIDASTASASTTMSPKRDGARRNENAGK